MRKGKCKLKSFGMFTFETLDRNKAELWFGMNTIFEFKEKENGNFLLIRKGMALSIPRADFERMSVISEEV